MAAAAAGGRRRCRAVSISCDQKTVNLSSGRWEHGKQHDGQYDAKSVRAPVAEIR